MVAGSYPDTPFRHKATPRRRRTPTQSVGEQLWTSIRQLFQEFPAGVDDDTPSSNDVEHRHISHESAIMYPSPDLLESMTFEEKEDIWRQSLTQIRRERLSSI